MDGTWTDWLAAALLIAGAFFSLVAGVGLVVLPDLLSRMHASAKPQVLGLLLMLTGLALEWGSWPWVPVLLAAWVMQMIAAPVASHLISRTGYRTKHARRDLLHRDDLAAQARRVPRVPRAPAPAATPDAEGRGPRADQGER